MIATQTFEISRECAHEIYRKYRTHRHYSKPVDFEIAKAYQAIAKGQMVVRALASIAAAGLGADGLPKLAIVRADAERCWLTLQRDGRARFAMKRWQKPNEVRQFIDLPAGSFAPGTYRSDQCALAPLIPIDIRPKRGLENYHVVFEAIWRQEPPVDPLLVRRIGKGDVWAVVAAWDVGEIERAVLSARIPAR